MSLLQKPPSAEELADILKRGATLCLIGCEYLNDDIAYDHANRGIKMPKPEDVVHGSFYVDAPTRVLNQLAAQWGYVRSDERFATHYNHDHPDGRWLQVALPQGRIRHRTITFFKVSPYRKIRT